MKKFDRTPRIVVPDGYKPKSVVLILGNHEVTVDKMSLGSFARCVKIAEPYIRELASVLFNTPAFRSAMTGEAVDPNVMETEIRSAATGKLTEMIATVPETVISLLACLMNFPEEGEATDFFWNVVNPGDLLNAIEKLDELNNFADIVTKFLNTIRYLGKRYGVEIPGVSIVEKETEEEKED